MLSQLLSRGGSALSSWEEVLFVCFGSPLVFQRAMATRSNPQAYEEKNHEIGQGEAQAALFVVHGAGEVKTSGGTTLPSNSPVLVKSAGMKWVAVCWIDSVRQMEGGK